MSEIRPATDVLSDLRSGSAHELTAAMAELAQAVQATNKKGTLTYKVTMSPSKTDDQAVAIVDDIVLKTPRPERPATLMFVSDSGSLSKHDPRQRTLPGTDAEVDR